MIFFFLCLKIYRTIIFWPHFLEHIKEHLAHCNADHVAMRDRFTALGAEMKMQVTVTRQEVFDAMHTI